MRMYSIVLGAAMLAAACSPAPSPAGEPSSQPTQSTETAGANPLAGTAWTLVELNGRAVSATRVPTLRFEQGDRLNGFAGCNTYFATYQVQGSQLQVADIGSTRMACTDERSTATEQQYLEALRTVSRWDRSGPTLTLSSDQRMVARFRLGAADATR